MQSSPKPHIVSTADYYDIIKWLLSYVIHHIHIHIHIVIVWLFLRTKHVLPILYILGDAFMLNIHYFSKWFRIFNIHFNWSIYSYTKMYIQFFHWFFDRVVSTTYYPSTNKIEQKSSSFSSFIVVGRGFALSLCLFHDWHRFASEFVSSTL